MDRRVMTMLLLLMTVTMMVSSWCVMGVTGYYRGGEEEEEEWGEEERGGGGGERKGVFVLDKWEEVVRTDAGVVRVVASPLLRGFHSCSGSDSDLGRLGGVGVRHGLMHIGFIFMEPNTLFVPQYLDSSLILFVRKGEVKVGWIHEDALVEKQLKMGDIIHIHAGSTFYMVNTGKGQRLQIICSIDASESIGLSPYQAFYVGGGAYPRSVLTGFDPATLATAFNVTEKELYTFLGAQTKGPIVYINSEVAERTPWWTSIGRGLVNTKTRDDSSDRYVSEETDEVDNGPWTWRKLLNKMLRVSSDNEDRRNKKGKPVQAPDPYNLYDRDPDYRNNYGWTIALDEHDYAPLKHSDIGVYLVNLTAGSMLTPHVNPRATEYGIVLGGSGRIQVVYPNGSTAMNVKVAEGDLFWIPQFLPFCQIASRSGPMEFFGFTTSAARNRPQFLIGASSVLRTMLGPELAAAFGISEARLRDAVEAQREAVIIPSWPEKRKKGRKGRREEEREEGEPSLIFKEVV
uniref:Cupin type-1 domain-containing protein n=1 Tax=Ananas comosus var. bracteatus TaxID=296719 RepID=A0A6V7QFC3_ANACO|nr:unnamed protein product [Ananas comosus var. bracteatus]